MHGIVLYKNIFKRYNILHVEHIYPYPTFSPSSHLPRLLLWIVLDSFMYFTSNIYVMPCIYIKWRNCMCTHVEGRRGHWASSSRTLHLCFDTMSLNEPWAHRWARLSGQRPSEIPFLPSQHSGYTPPRLAFSLGSRSQNVGLQACATGTSSYPPCSASQNSLWSLPLEAFVGYLLFW